MPGAYYNEFDPYAAQWLRNLIAQGHIAPGDVDTRSIEDVSPDDLRGYTQCHFFAGIGVWSLALRRAGWSDDRPVWTGSCPCQPFSSAGKGDGFADERHLWPAFHWLIGQCRPAIVLGEQVASKDAEPWIDLVQIDLETLGYAVGAVPFPSAGVGAPHIRDRLYWVADSGSNGLEGGLRRGSDSQRQTVHGSLGCDRAACEFCGHRFDVERLGRYGCPNCEGEGLDGSQPATLGGFWSDVDWLQCRDGRWRPVEPGTFPLADGASERVGRLRAYGNAVNAEAARVFIECVMGV